MIINKTTNQVLSNREIVCKTYISQARGLMFYRRKRNVTMIFPRERRISLHMFFVKYPIDVLIVNTEKEIVEIKRNFQPWTFWKSRKRGKYVVELSNSVECRVGDVISFLQNK